MLSVLKRLAIGTMATGALVAPLATAVSSAGASTARPASMIIGDPGIYLQHTQTLTAAAPNVVTSGKSVVLKTCLNNGDCTVFANDKASETWDFVPSTNGLFSGYSEVRLHGSTGLVAGGWCWTNRGSTVTLEACAQFASQEFTGSYGTLYGVITNGKTGLNVGPTAVAAYAHLQASAQEPRWGNSS